MNVEQRTSRVVIEMEAWTDLNRAAIRDRLRERTDEAAADRLAAQARSSASADRVVLAWRLSMFDRPSRTPSKA
jgi:hypothetical protein